MKKLQNERHKTEIDNVVLAMCFSLFQQLHFVCDGQVRQNVDDRWRQLEVGDNKNTDSLFWQMLDDKHIHHQQQQQSIITFSSKVANHHYHQQQQHKQQQKQSCQSSPSLSPSPLLPITIIISKQQQQSCRIITILSPP